jgi:hypothetical protein
MFVSLLGFLKKEAGKGLEFVLAAWFAPDRRLIWIYLFGSRESAYKL